MRNTLEIENPTSQELYDTLKYARGKYKNVKVKYKHYTRTFKVQPVSDPFGYENL